jgi:hypothetical protein
MIARGWANPGRDTESWPTPAEILLRMGQALQDFLFIFNFYDEPYWKAITACYRGGFFGSTYTPVVAMAGQNYPGYEGALSPSPIQPAFQSSTSGCPFEVGLVGLAPTKTRMVVGAPRSYLTPRASTLARRDITETPTPGRRIVIIACASVCLLI